LLGDVGECAMDERGKARRHRSILRKAAEFLIL
jgi:hypothetical protein